MLADPNPQVRTAAARGLLGDRFQRQDVPLSPEDRRIVKAAGIVPDGDGLLAFFRSRTLSDEARKELEQLVKDLDSAVFATRQEAAKKLVQAGTPALPFINAALAQKNSLEMTRRLERCKEDIQMGPGPALPMAAARLLLRRNPPEAMKVLLDYAPFADDSAVEEQVLDVLAQLSVQGPKVPETLRNGLKDELPGRRGAAALVLGLVGEKDHVAAVKPLLEDEQPRVRLRASQGLIAAREKDAVPVLIALLGDAPMADAVQAEELLRQVGGTKAPALFISDGTTEGRKKGHEAWVAWWRDHGATVALTGPMRDRPYLGLTLVAELNYGRRGPHRLWEFGRDGKVRWETNEPINPIDAHILPNNHVLVAEYTGNRVTERDLNTKQVVWEKKTNGFVVSCQRLSNGNTFIATYNAGVLEVTPDGKEVYNFNPVQNVGAIVNALKLRNGQIACLSTQGSLLELDTTGKLLKSTMLDVANGAWNGIEELPGGRLLVALQQQGKVKELDASRKSVWECSAPGAVHAVRLPDGHTLIAGGNTQKLLEVDHAGKVVWEKATTGRPFHVRRR
jgi:HEAT repeat protein